MSDNIVQRVAMKGVVVRGGRVLILREASTYADGTNAGRYHFPGGRIEPGESWKDGLYREVREETGLTITVKQPIFVGEWFPEIRGVKNHIVALFMICDAHEGDVALSSEHDDYQWVDAESWKAFNLMPPDDEVLTAYFKLA